jgi:adenosinetriphosphatase
MKLDKVFDSPCTADQMPTPYSPQDPLTVIGTGHYQHCLGNMSKIFSFDRCSFSKCSFDGVFQPNVTGSFMVRRIPCMEHTLGSIHGSLSE